MSGAIRVWVLVLSISTGLLVNTNFAYANVCPARNTDIPSALKRASQTWDLSRSIASGWMISVGKHSTRSTYEIYSRYAGLSFVLGVSAEEAMTMLDRSGKVGPKVTGGWQWEDYARMGEAALITGRPLNEAMRYLADVYAASDEWWLSADYSRAANAGFIAGVSAAETFKTMKSAAAASDYSGWSNGAFSRAAESALTAGISASQAAAMMDEVYREVYKQSWGWGDDDYARVARAASIAGISAHEAAAILKEVYDQTVALSGVWHNQDYSRMASAAIITGKSPREAAEALRDAWDLRANLAPGWNYADYAMMAAAGLIGRGESASEQCLNLYRAW